MFPTFARPSLRCLAVLMVLGRALGQEAAPPQPAVSTPALQRPFEGIYSAWRDAMARGDVKAWEQVTAQARQNRTRNEIVSQRLRFPEALFEVPLAAPDLRGLIHLDTLSRGDTASGIYFGKADFGLGDAGAIKDNFVVLRFTREFGAWKFDNLRVVKFGEDPELLAKVRNRDRSYLEAPEFQPDAVPAAAMPLVNTPDYIGELWVTAAGYEAVVMVNGQHRTAITNDSGRDLVMGGLGKGVNRIQVTVKPATVDGGVTRHLEIGIYGAAKPGEQAKRVYHFRSTPGTEPASYETTFVVP